MSQTPEQLERSVAGMGATRVDDTSYKKSKKIGGKVVWKCPYYTKWTSMFYRLTGSYIKKRPSYKGVKVCDEWHTFSNFKKWLESNVDSFGEEETFKRNLDKDILVKGNKEYSPKTCLLVLPETNNFFVTKDERGSHLPTGVYWNSRDNRYQANFKKDGKTKNLGLFKCPDEAYQAWLKAKREHAFVIASREIDPVVKEAVETHFIKYWS